MRSSRTTTAEPDAPSSAALRLLADLDRAATIAQECGDDALANLMRTTRDAATDQLARAAVLAREADVPAIHRAVQESHAEATAWTPVVMCVHGLAQQMFATIRYAQAHPTLVADPDRMAAMLRAWDETRPAGG